MISTSFSALFDLARVQQLLDEATGTGVKVGVLDTGVDSRHPALEGCLRASFEIAHDGEGGAEVRRLVDGRDPVAHGTACAGIIHKIAPKADLFSVEVMNPNQRNSPEKLIAGLQLALDEGWDVINLSAGLGRFDLGVFEVLEDAFYKNVIVVVAKSNEPDQIGYPAKTSNVIAVDMEHFENPLGLTYRSGERVEIEANGIYIEAPVPDGEFRSFTGTSFACPNVSGIAARLREAIPNLTPFQFRTILAELGKPA
ncbi:MAG: subtilisin [Verrucomicrobiales bacterium]|jgi:subtilisin